MKTYNILACILGIAYKVFIEICFEQILYISSIENAHNSGMFAPLLCLDIKFMSVFKNSEDASTVIPRLTKIIRSGITFVSRNFR